MTTLLTIAICAFLALMLVGTTGVVVLVIEDAAKIVRQWRRR
jgi:hypothetical protein